MGRVAVGLTMSLDGFIAGLNDGPERPLGEGGERLFAWYSGGDTKYRLRGTEAELRAPPARAGGVLRRRGCGRLFAGASGGDTKCGLRGPEMVFRVSPQSAELLREAHGKMGAFV